MKRTCISFLLIGILYLVIVKSAGAAFLVVDASAHLKVHEAANTSIKKEKDTRVGQLQAYLASHYSPLTEMAEVFIQKADEYELPDWRLVPAISGVESTFGKHIPNNSYNAWGWANGAYAFTSWEDAIDIVTKALKQKYVDRGLDTPEKMSPVYAPPSKTWAGKVRFFMEKIDQFEPEQDREFELSL